MLEDTIIKLALKNPRFHNRLKSAARRMRFPRSDYLPKELASEEPWVPEGTNLSIWEWEDPKTGFPVAIVFKGKQSKPILYQKFRSDAQKRSALNEEIKGNRAWMEHKKKKQEERKSFSHGYKEGDFLYSSWGYEQTNVDFFQVIGLKGKSIIIREVMPREARSSRTQHYLVPWRNRWVRGSQPMKRTPRGPSVKIDNVRRAWKWEGKPIRQTDSRFGH
jgi:hypothetical protein